MRCACTVEIAPWILSLGETNSLKATHPAHRPNAGCNLDATSLLLENFYFFGAGRLQELGDGATACGESIDSPSDLRGFNKWWRVMRLDPRIENQWTNTTPMLVLNRFPHPAHIGGRIATGECDP